MTDITVAGVKERLADPQWQDKAALLNDALRVIEGLERTNRTQAAILDQWQPERQEAKAEIEEYKSLLAEELDWKDGRLEKAQAEIERRDNEFGELCVERDRLLARCQQLETERDEWRARASLASQSENG